jgi:hypothetical protein
MSRTLAPAILAAVAVASASCAIFTEPKVDSVIDAVSTIEGIQGSFVNAGAPKEGGSPDASAIALGAAIPGGSVPVRMTTTAQASEIAVFIEGMGGHYLVTLGTSTDTITLVVTLSQVIPDTAFTITYALADGGEFGTYARTTIRPTLVGTGEVQVSVAWDDTSDVDLHVVDPAGDEIYWAKRQVSSGGQLDLDSNAGCSIDNVNQENATWSTAPGGDYIVRVDYWSSCGVAETNFIVTVQVKGRDPQIFTGKLTGLGDNGGQGSGTEITRFTF